MDIQGTPSATFKRIYDVNKNNRLTHERERERERGTFVRCWMTSRTVNSCVYCPSNDERASERPTSVKHGNGTDRLVMIVDLRVYSLSFAVYRAIRITS